MKINCSKKQRGTVVVVVTIALPVLLLAMGWALDFGHVFVNKTRLQNALDATALSAAIAINGDITKNTAAATLKGKDTFKKFIAGSGNAELSGLNDGSLKFEYSRELKNFIDGTVPPTFVRVTSVNMLNVTPVLIRIVNQFSNPMPVPAFATAGAVGQNCSLTPFVMCANMSPLDTNCEDDSGGTVGNDCYGYEIGKINSLVIACNGNTNNCGPNSLESGNYNLLNLDGSQGGKDIRDTLQGTTNICLQGNTLDTKPGWTWGNVKQGIDNRFDSDTQTTPYPIGGIYPPSPYTQYKTGGLGNARREMAAPIGDCTGLQTGASTIPKVGTACVFLTEKAVQGPGPIKAINVEFTGASCQQNGVFSPTNAVLNGPYKVVLFKSPGSGDS